MLHGVAFVAIVIWGGDRLLLAFLGEISVVNYIATELPNPVVEKD